MSELDDLEEYVTKPFAGRWGRGRRKTRSTCGYGHEFTDANTYFHKGDRHCRECNRLNAREQRARQKAKQLRECS